MNPEKVRKDFPILSEKNPPVYFDNACTTLKPVQVLDKINEYYREYPSCGGRSHHRLGERVTEETHKSRKAIADFFSARKAEEIVFTRNTTEGMNLVANSLGLNEGDKVLTSDKEHNSNLIPWIVAKSRGIVHEMFEFNNLDEFSEKVQGARLVSIVHTSNVDGSSNNVAEMIKIAHENNALVLLDAAQSAPHKEINVRKMDVDFLACSAHKMLGPSGMGMLYGKMELLEKLNQYMVGGDTVKNSEYGSFIPEDIPERFEAGLQNYSGMVGFAEATRYLKKIGMDDIEEHEHRLNKIATDAFRGLGIDILGPKDAEERGGVVSFNIGKMDPHDIALMLDSNRIMIRSGMHCVHSWFNAHNIKGSARASLYLYNTEQEVEEMVKRIKDIAVLAK